MIFLVAWPGLPWATPVTEGTTGTDGLEENRQVKTHSDDHSQQSDGFGEQLKIRTSQHHL